MSDPSEMTLAELIGLHQQALCIASHLMASTAVATAARALQEGDAERLAHAAEYNQAADLIVNLLRHIGLSDEAILAGTAAGLGLPPEVRPDAEGTAILNLLRSFDPK